MNWLKDKKNLPIVAGLAAFVLVGAVVLILFLSGVLGGSSNSAAPTPPMVTMSSPPPMPGGPPGMMPPGQPGSMAGMSRPNGLPKPKMPLLKKPMAPGMPKPMAGAPGMPPVPGAPGMPSAPGVPGRPPMKGALAPGAKVVTADPTIINPHVGPDPFSIPGGVQKLKQIREATNPGGLSMPLRSLLPTMNLWNYQPPQPPMPTPDLSSSSITDPSAPVMRLLGIAHTSTGDFAILEVAGQAQTVKPGDPIPGGGQVLTIQLDNISVRTGAGQTVTIPLSSGPAPANSQSAPGAANFAPAQSMDQPQL